MLVGKSPWLASQWLFRSPGNLVSSTAATSTWFHARRDKHSSAGPACLADTHYAYLSGGSSGQSGRLRYLRARPQHFSADGHRDKAAPPLPPASPATFYPQSSEQHHASEVSLKGVPVHWTPLEGFSEQETTLRGIVAALPVHWFRFTLEKQPFLFTLENQPLKPFLQ